MKGKVCIFSLIANFEFWYSGELNPMEQGKEDEIKMHDENTIIVMDIVGYKIGIEQWRI